MSSRWNQLSESTFAHPAKTGVAHCTKLHRKALLAAAAAQFGLRQVLQASVTTATPDLCCSTFCLSPFPGKKSRLGQAAGSRQSAAMVNKGKLEQNTALKVDTHQWCLSPIIISLFTRVHAQCLRRLHQVCVHSQTSHYIFLSVRGVSAAISCKCFSTGWMTTTA